MSRRVAKSAVAAALGATLALSGCAPGASPGADPASGAVLGVVLSGLVNQVDGVVAHVDNAVEGNVIVAAANVRYTLDNATSAWSSELSKQQSQLDASINASLGKLNAMVADLTSGQKQAIAEAGAQALTVANTLPLANRSPQVSAYSPHLDAADEQPVQVTIDGNFPDAMKPDQRPFLNIGQQTITPNRVTTKSLGFEVPAGALPPFGATTLQPVSLDLTVPYKEGLIFKDLKPGTFRLLLSQVPMSPVKSLTVIDSVHSQVEERRQTVSDTWTVDSLAAGKNVEGKRLGVQAEPGWRIDPASARIVVDFIKVPEKVVGPHWVLKTGTDLITETSAFACFVGPFGSCGSGRVHFHLVYDQVRSHEVTTPRESENLALRWNDTISRQVATPREWTVNAVLFDGTVLQLTTSSRTSRFLTVDDNGHAVTIHATDLSTLLT